MTIYRHIVITGASSGIGAELAKRYSEEKNIRLSLLGQNKERLFETVRQCERNGAQVFYALIDVTDQRSMKEWLQQQESYLSVDLLIVNAGCSLKQAMDTCQNNEEAEHRLFDVHLHGTLNTVQPLLQRMQEKKAGHIAIMASLNSFICLPDSKIYGAAKAALLHYGLALRGAVAAQHVHVSVICPGWVHSALTARNSFPMPGIMATAEAAARIQRGLRRKKAVIAFPTSMYLLVRLVQMLPVAIQQFLCKANNHLQ